MQSQMTFPVERPFRVVEQPFRVVEWPFTFVEWRFRNVEWRSTNVKCHSIGGMMGEMVKDEKTTFQFRMPSEGGVELEFYFRALPRAFSYFFYNFAAKTSEAN